MPQQVSRLAIIFVVLIVGLLAARHFLVPPTFGELGHYRAAAVDSILTTPIHYVGEQLCAECHDDIADLKRDSWHAGLSCEVCHGPGGRHVEDPESFKPPAPRQRGYCPLCHGYQASRPTGFPQIDPVTHNPMKPCIGCHDPHQPTTPHVPESCSACHGEIARTKAISHHATLLCTQCHEADDGHKENPRSVRPTKPQTRAACGHCHAKGSDAPREIPRIAMEDHGNGYVCWQCHYPHYPEVD